MNSFLFPQKCLKMFSMTPYDLLGIFIIATLEIFIDFLCTLFVRHRPIWTFNISSISAGKSENNVILRKSDNCDSLRLAGASLEGVPRGEIWCTYLCAHNINMFFGNTEADTGQSKYFLTSSKLVRRVEPVLASQCHIQVSTRTHLVILNVFLDADRWIFPALYIWD